MHRYRIEAGKREMGVKLALFEDIVCTTSAVSNQHRP